MKTVYICDAVRTPIGRYGGVLSSVRTDDLAAIPLKTMMDRHPQVDWKQTDDVLMGCANQAGEDNRNVARMALLLAGFSETVPGVTINRLCGSGMEAVGQAARMIQAGDGHLILAGGVESMSRAPFVMGKAAEPFSRTMELQDTTIGWRFINKKMEKLYGVDSMMQTAENLAQEYHISREDQDRFAMWSQEKALQAQRQGLFKNEIIPVAVIKGKNETVMIEQDEHPRQTSLEKLATLKPLTGENGTITAGNASGVNDGASVLLMASEEAVKSFQLKPLARVLGWQVAGVLPRVMGIGPVPAVQKLLAKTGFNLNHFDLIEFNEAFAAQVLAVIRLLGLNDQDPRINPLGGAIALGHPLGMSGARLITTAVHQLHQRNEKKALCAMCIGVGQGIAMAVEKV